MIATKRVQHNFNTKPKQQQFHKLLALEGMAELQYDNQQIGVAILKPRRRNQLPRFLIAFSTKGFAPNLSEAQTAATLKRMEEWLNALPQSESIFFRVEKFADDRKQQEKLNEDLICGRSDIERILTYSKKSRIQQLTQSGDRQHSKVTVYCTITPSSASIEPSNKLEKLLQLVSNSLEPLQQQTTKEQKNNLAKLFDRIYNDNYQDWLNVMGRMGLNVEPLDAAALWTSLSSASSRKQTPPIPQLITTDESGIREDIYTDVHPSVAIMRYGVPEAAPDHIRIGDRYVGCNTMQDKPKGYADAKDQFRYLFKVLADPAVRDTEFFIQISPTDSQMQRSALQLLNRQSNNQVISASEQSSNDVAAQMKADETVQAQQALAVGSSTLRIGFVVLVHRSSLQQLRTDCKKICSKFTGCWMDRECYLAPQTWLQTLLISGQDLENYRFFNRQHVLLSHEATGFVPSAMPQTHDDNGIELITEEGSVPFWINFFKPHKRLSLRSALICATTRGGKSILVSEILLNAILKGLLVTVLDYPRGDGTSTFTAFTELLKGNYIDIAREDINVMEPPDLSEVPEEEQQNVLANFQAAMLSTLIQLVIGNTPAEQLPAPESTIKSVLKLATHEFLKDASIAARARDAHQAGQGSAEWQLMPTLGDFLHLLRNESFEGRFPEASSMQDAIDYCIVHIDAAIHSSGVGRAISRPATVRLDSQLVVFGFTNVTDEDDMATLALCANLIALRRALLSQISLLFIDESPIFLKNEQFSKMTGRICANGAKAGISVVLAAQDPDTIAESAAGSQILQNLNTRLIGRIQPAAIKSFEKHLDVPRSAITANASEGFFPNPQGIYSNWVLDDGGTFTRCRFYPSPILLALTANNPDEHQARIVVMQQFPNRPIEGIATFAKLLTLSIQTSTDLTETVNRWLSARASSMNS